MKTKKKYLKNKLIISNLFISLLGVFTLIIALSAFYWLYKNTMKIYKNTFPFIKATYKLDENITYSETLLFKWTLTADPKYVVARRKLWEKEIPKTLSYLINYMKKEKNPSIDHDLHNLKKILKSLQLWQWRVEDVAQSQGNLPIANFIQQHMEKNVSNTLDVLTELITNEENITRVNNQKLLPLLVKLRWSFSKSWQSLKNFEQKNRPQALEISKKYLEEVSHNLELINQFKESLSDREKESFQDLKKFLNQYNYFFNLLTTKVKKRNVNIATAWSKSKTIPQTDLAQNLLDKLLAFEKSKKNKDEKYVLLIGYIIFVLSILLVVVLLLLSYIFATRNAKKIITPINSLLKGMRQITENTLQNDLPIESDDEIGELTHFFNTMRKKIQTIEKKLNGVIESALDPIIIINNKGIIESCNTATYELFGYAHSELVGQNISILMPEPHHSKHDSYLKKYKKTKTKNVIGRVIQVNGVTKSRELIPLQLGVSEVIVGNEQYFAGILRNLTQEVEASKKIKSINDSLKKENLYRTQESNIENQLKKSSTIKELGENLLEYFNNYFSIPYSIFYNVDNGKASKLCSRGITNKDDTTDEDEGGSIIKQCIADQKHTLITDIENDSSVITTGIYEIQPKQCFVLPIIYNNALKAIVELYKLSEFSKEDQELLIYLSQTIAVNYNLTHSNELLKIQFKLTKEKSKQLKISKIEAEKANKAKSFFLSNMSHEIRTPLNAIIGYSELISRDKNLDQKQRKNIFLIIESGKHLLGLINDILDLSKIESGKIELSTDTVFLFALIEECKGISQPLAQKFNVELELDVSKHIYVIADYFRLKQVILNLISNAIKYNVSGKKVKLVTKFLDDKKISLGVQDKGQGISKEEQRNLFQPFSRLDRNATIEGTGIGLVICKRLIEEMGGKIFIESEIGQGSTFWITLNLAENPTKKIKPSLPYKLTNIFIKNKEQYHILVAEDNPLNQELLKQQITTLGYQYKIVANGVECYEEWKKTHYDIILMDCHMPNSDGYETTINIRKAEKATGLHIPIIAYTADVFKEVVKRCKSVGMDDYISKPTEIETLNNKLTLWLSKSIAQKQTLLVDLSVIAKITDGDQKAQKKLFSVFIDTTKKIQVDLNQAIREKSYEHIAALMHKLKSSSKAIGALPFADLCNALESAAKQQSSWINVQEKHQQFETMLNSIFDIIKEVIK